VARGAIANDLDLTGGWLADLREQSPEGKGVLPARSSARQLDSPAGAAARPCPGTLADPCPSPDKETPPTTRPPPRTGREVCLWPIAENRDSPPLLIAFRTATPAPRWVCSTIP